MQMQEAIKNSSHIWIQNPKREINGSDRRRDESNKVWRAKRQIPQMNQSLQDTSALAWVARLRQVVFTCYQQKNLFNVGNRGAQTIWWWVFSACAAFFFLWSSRLHLGLCSPPGRFFSISAFTRRSSFSERLALEERRAAECGERSGPLGVPSLDLRNSDVGLDQCNQCPYETWLSLVRFPPKPCGAAANVV